MTSKKVWLALGVLAALVLAAPVPAESSDKKAGAGARGACADGFQSIADRDGAGFKGGGKGGGGDAFRGGGGRGGFGGGAGGFGGGQGGRGLSVDEIVDRIMSFDKNKTGKVTKDMLPERMQFLIERGDTNKDGALDRDEVKKLAADLAREGFNGFGGGRGGFGDAFRGGGGGGGFGPGGFGGFGAGGARGGNVERTVADLKLSGKTKDKADAVVKAHEENVRKLMELAHSDLLQKMKDVLSDQEFKNFKDALDRQGRPGDRFIGSGSATGSAPKQSDQDKKLEQLQKQLDDLRRELRR
jgi:hypothetical protein